VVRQMGLATTLRGQILSWEVNGLKGTSNVEILPMHLFHTSSTGGENQETHSAGALLGRSMQHWAIGY